MNQRDARQLMKNYLFILIVLFFIDNTIAQTCPTTYTYRETTNNATWTTSNNGDWAAAGGSVTVGGKPPYPTNTTYVFNSVSYTNCIVIPAGQVVAIDGNSFNLGTGINLVVEGTLVVNGGLNLASGRALIIQTGGLVCCNPACSASDKITNGGNSNPIWGGSTGNFNPVVGPTISTGGPLPIDLLFFKASKGLSTIKLSWATASELNFDYFDIEKSTDGINFKSIATVKGNGTTSERNDYTLDDEKPMIGKNYYRLKSIDYDGYTEYFEVVMVDFDGKKNFAVYPNPTDGIKFNAETNFSPERNAFVTIYSTNGVEIARYRISGDQSELTMPVKLEAGL